MNKLIQGIIDFRQRILPARRAMFAELAKGQHPDSLFITCSDSRVAPNWFASTDPGELFVIRNVGNLIPPYREIGVLPGDDSVLAAVEFALKTWSVADIIVCGHSDCGAMHAIAAEKAMDGCPHLNAWLKNGSASLESLKSSKFQNQSLTKVNQLSQVNVLEQIENLKTHPMVRDRIAAKKLKLHGWWFNIATADVYSFDAGRGKFELIGS